MNLSTFWFVVLSLLAFLYGLWSVSRRIARIMEIEIPDALLTWKQPVRWRPSGDLFGTMLISLESIHFIALYGLVLPVILEYQGWNQLFGFVNRNIRGLDLLIGSLTIALLSYFLGVSLVPFLRRLCKAGTRVQITEEGIQQGNLSTPWAHISHFQINSAEQEITLYSAQNPQLTISLLHPREPDTFNSLQGTLSDHLPTQPPSIEVSWLDRKPVVLTGFTLLILCSVLLSWWLLRFQSSWVFFPILLLALGTWRLRGAWVLKFI